MGQTFTGMIYQFGERTLEIPEKIDRMTSFYSK